MDQADGPAPEIDPAAEMWGLGGDDYDLVSFAIGDALAHAAQRLAPAPGDHVLDVATGTGWTARNIARQGARVSAIDFSPGMIDAARRLSAHVRPGIDFRIASAEALPFPDGEFDAVISTFGVMFAPDQRRAADELARVCKPGGRVVLANWVPGGSVAAFLGLLAAHGDAPPPGASPFAWGDRDAVRALLGTAFELDFEDGTNRAHHENEAAIWAWYVRGFGPVRHAVAQRDAAGRAQLRQEVDAYHAAYRTPGGRLLVKRDYLLTIGRRR